MQLMLVGLGLAGLTLFGLSLDYLRHQALPDSARAPRWPLGIEPPAGWDPMSVVLLLSGAMLAVAAAYACLRFSTIVAGARLSQKIIVSLRREVYDKLQRLSFRFFDQSTSGSIINRVTGDVQSVRMFIDGVVMQFVLVVLTLVVYVTYMLRTNAVLTLVSLGTAPVMFLLSRRFSKTVRPWYRRARELGDALILRLSENIQGMHVVKCFGRQAIENRRFQTANRRIKWQRRGIFHLTSMFIPSIEGMSSLNMCLLMLFGGYMVMTNEDFTLGQGYVVFAGLLSGFSSQVNQLANITNTVQYSLTGAQRVFEVLDQPVEIQNPPRPVHVERAEGRVAFEGVTFGYRDLDPVLEEIGFEAEPGQCVAVVGATGAGKSTLLSLIPRFYDPRRGRVRIDGRDVREYDLDDLRRNVGLVFQESFLFSNTVAANIAFGHPEATEAQVRKAAEIAAAADFIEELPDKYQTVIGEHGSNLSGGQRQRLAIARAILLEPPILLLDDATSAVDPETEHEILAAMDRAMQGRTTFVVAHRLSTLRRADQVIVLDKGRIIQRGTHEELMNVKGHYRRAASLQVADAESKRLLGVGEGAA
ncbi:MAG: ABC transporter ATP-binding protein [Phycisphaeraceae bacterium]|nr:ABC transporter ATP-binding protein [Phycisphaeraceae bacterium]